MNTGNLQIEGLLLAVAAINRALVQKGVLSGEEMERALHAAEVRAAGDERMEELPPAYRDAVCFPIRLLRLANGAAGQPDDLYFSDLARAVGRSKPAYNDQM